MSEFTTGWLSFRVRCALFFRAVRSATGAVILVQVSSNGSI